HIADRAEFFDPTPDVCRGFPAFVGIENDLQLRRSVGNISAPAGNIVFQAAFELYAVEACRGDASDERIDVVQRAVARPGANTNLRLHLAAEQVNQRQAMPLGKGVPNSALETVVFAAVSDRQLLTRQVF